MTVVELGIQERLAKEGFNLIDRDKARNFEERMELMRKALLCDTFLCSSNAISEDGQLVNIDNYGNRVAAMIFGPKQVIVVAGINKVVKTVEDATVRAQTIVAPLNIQRFPDIPTPCNKTGNCANCATQNTVCNLFCSYQTLQARRTNKSNIGREKFRSLKWSMATALFPLRRHCLHCAFCEVV